MFFCLFLNTMLEINFLAGGKYLLPGIECSSKTKIPVVANIVCCITAQLPPNVKLYDKTKFCMVKSIDNA